MPQAVQTFVFLNPPGTFELLILALLFIVLVIGTALSSRSLRSRRLRGAIFCLRVVTFLSLSVILFNPSVRIENYREEKPRIAVLIDSSYSMNLPFGKGKSSKFEAVFDYFKRHADFFGKLEDKFIASYYRFDDELLPASKESLKDIKPLGKRTQIVKALNELKADDDISGVKFDAAVIISDGADTEYGAEGKRTDKTIEQTINQGFPVYTIAVGAKPPKDIWIEEVRYSPIAFLRRPFTVEVVVGAHKMKSEKMPVTLKEGDNVISTALSKKIPSSQRVIASFVIDPVTAGRNVYNVSLPDISGDTVAENNEMSFVVDTLIDRIRVLHISGNPSWDTKFLRRTLKRNPIVDLVGFFILRDTSDFVFASTNELSLIPFPVDEIFLAGLKSFDIVIFQDFYPITYGLRSAHVRNLKRHVTEKGGAFIIVGGERSFKGGGFLRTGLEDLLPIEPDYSGMGYVKNFTRRDVKAMLTPLGYKHPVMRIVPNERNNMDNWNALPKLNGYNNTAGIKNKAATVLKTVDDKPLLVLNELGRGKVAALLSDSSWKWAFMPSTEGERADYYERFWGRLVRWLVNDPDLKDIRVSTDKSVYNPGDTVKLSYWRLTEGDAQESDDLSLGVRSERYGDIKEAIIMEEKRNGYYEGEIVAEGLGKNTFTAYDPDENKIIQKQPLQKEPLDATYFVVEPPADEIRGVTVDPSFLRDLSENTGGSFITLDDHPSKLGIDFSPKLVSENYRTVSLWDKPWFFAVIVALIASELILRRRWGLK